MGKKKQRNKVAVDDAMMVRFEKAAKKTWQIIGNDMLQAAQEGGEDTVPQDAVHDAVYNGITHYGGDKEAIDLFMEIEVLDAFKILKKIFPAKRYS